MFLKDWYQIQLGTPQNGMKLILQDLNGSTIGPLDDESKKLGYYDVQNDYIIHIIDLNPNSILKELEEFEKVEKYVMSEQEYDSLPNNFRKFKEMLNQNPNFFQEKKQLNINDEFMMSEAYSLQIGARFRLIEKGHRGTIMYIGRVPEVGKGYYIGIKLDEPYGKNDGSQFYKNRVLEEKYFECPDKFGLFVRPNKIEVGDYPELDLEDEI